MFLLFSALSAEASTSLVLTFKQKSIGKTEYVCEIKSYLERTRIRRDAICPTTNFSTIFHKEWKFLLEVNNTERTYTKGTAGEIKAQKKKSFEKSLRDAKSHAAKDPKARTDKLKAFEALEKSRNSKQLKPPPLTVKATGKRKKLKELDCAIHEVYIGKKLSQEHCVAEWEKNAVLKPLKFVILDMSTFFGNYKDPVSQLQRKGVTLESKFYLEDKVISSTEFISMTREEKLDNFFAVPISYKEN